MKLPLSSLIVGIVIAAVAPSCVAVSTAYVAPGTPASQIFTAIPFGPSSLTMGIADDMGRPAWSISGSGMASQFGYASGTFSNDQLAAISSNGFILSLTARAVRGISLPFDSTNHIVILGTEVEFGNKRFEIDLGLDSNGDTVVSLPTTLDNAGPGSSVRSFGANYTLAGSGSTYHLYQLQYDPLSQRATLAVDGISRLFNYTGNTSFGDNRGLVWFAASGGTGNFNTVQISMVSEPATSVMLVVGGVALLGLKRRRQLLDGKNDA